MAGLIRAARRKKGLNQAQFAALIGKSQGMVSRYESGESVPPGDVIMHCMHSVSPDSISSDRVQALEQLRQAAEALLSAIITLQEVDSSDA
ncbi:helix-turn-helix domain-containing protein (plasmid) [Agrobacterium sp. rho-13.3]|uniref:helix-turn-helix transcriptional regulator n=1 Tax=Agrobacterium sp. rho-13.3 TaxID=3072980 RepID=UPI002A117E15|nr:helix-turn-helix transcriptional regulator [Agrobacterium sp. rho-13.3]MDX8311543.1 helix-turn-helix transcriptional regulator [Agrobacterium sp. rho-13.3]